MVSEAKTYVSDGKAFQMSCVLFYQNWEEKSLRHLAMVEKFLDDRKPKTSLKKWIRTVSDFIDLIQFLLTCQMLTKFAGIESERTVFKFRKRKNKLCCVHLLYKAGEWN